MARLLLATPEGQQTVELQARNSLGRHPNNSIQLLDKIVSKEHCIIELRGDHFVLRDLGSLNGTFVNNQRVSGESPLKHGDEIALGSTRGRFDDGTAPLPPLAPPVSGQPAWGPPANVHPAPGGPPQTPGPAPLAQSAQVMPSGPFPKPPYSTPYARSGAPPSAVPSTAAIPP